MHGQRLATHLADVLPYLYHVGLLAPLATSLATACPSKSMSTDNYDDLALEIFENLERRKRSLLLDEEMANERWWIVMHAKVAVRPAPAKQGDPLLVLPRGAVLAAQTIIKVGRERWLRVHADELPFLKKNESLPKPHEAYMLIESDEIGTLVMAAPHEYDWHMLKELHPKHRGEVARQQMLRMLGGPMIDEATDVEALVANASAPPKAAEAAAGDERPAPSCSADCAHAHGGSAADSSQSSSQAPSRAPPTASDTEARRPERGVLVRELPDGLVDVVAPTRSYDGACGRA